MRSWFIMEAQFLVSGRGGDLRCPPRVRSAGWCSPVPPPPPYCRERNWSASSGCCQNCSKFPLRQRITSECVDGAGEEAVVVCMQICGAAGSALALSGALWLTGCCSTKLSCLAWLSFQSRWNKWAAAELVGAAYKGAVWLTKSSVWDESGRGWEGSFCFGELGQAWKKRHSSRELSIQTWTFYSSRRSGVSHAFD